MKNHYPGGKACRIDRLEEGTGRDGQNDGFAAFPEFTGMLAEDGLNEQARRKSFLDNGQEKRDNNPGICWFSAPERLQEECAVEQKARMVNIEEIMEEIRKEAEALRYEEPVSFEDVEIPLAPGQGGGAEGFELKKLEGTLTHVNSLWSIPYGHEISGNPLKKLLARAARKVNKPTGAPMAQDITRFNAEVAQSLNDIMLYIREAEKKAEEQEHRIFELEAEIRQLKEGAEKKA